MSIFMSEENSQLSLDFESQESEVKKPIIKFSRFCSPTVVASKIMENGKIVDTAVNSQSALKAAVKSNLNSSKDSNNQDKQVSVLDDGEEVLEERITPFEVFLSESKHVNGEYTGSIADPAKVEKFFFEHDLHFQGRKTLLVPHIFLKIIELKEKYNLPDWRVCHAIGVDPNNMQIWKKRGTLSPNNAQFSQYFCYFYWCMQIASTRLESRCLDNIEVAGMSDWKASRWLLSKVHFDRYGESIGSTGSVNGETSKPEVSVNINLNMSDLKTINSSLESFISSAAIIDMEE